MRIKQVAAGVKTTSLHLKRRNTNEAKHTYEVFVGPLLKAASDNCGK